MAARRDAAASAAGRVRMGGESSIGAGSPQRLASKAKGTLAGETYERRPCGRGTRRAPLRARNTKGALAGALGEAAKRGLRKLRGGLLRPADEEAVGPDDVL